MATIGQKGLTLADLSKRTGADGRIQKVAEILNQQNGIDSIVWSRGNLDLGNMYAVRSALPSDAGTRRVGEGVTLSNSVVGQATDTAAHFERVSSVDELLYDLAADKEEYLMSESRAYIEKMGQDVVNTLFYGNVATNSSKFNGIATKMNSTSSFTTVFKDAGSTNCTSIYLAVWGERSVYGFFPKNTQAGLKMGPTVREPVYGTDANGDTTIRYAYNTQFKWDCGVTIENWRQVSRYANIDVTALKHDGSSGALLLKNMVIMLNAVQNLQAGTPVFYVNRTIKTYLDLQETYKTNAHLRLEEVEGRQDRVLTFRGIPVVMVEQISNSETAIS